MAFTSIIDRSDAGALIPEDVSQEIVQGVAEASAVMRLATRAPDMPRAQRRIPVLSVLPLAYFVSGDTGLKQTTEMAWGNKFLNAEEIACIVPIPESVIDDDDYDIWGEIRPRIVEAMGIVFDQAVLFGVNAPASWPTNVRAAAVAAGNSRAIGADLYESVMGETGVVGLVEVDGFMVTGHIAAMSMRARLRGLRTADGVPIFHRVIQEATRYELDGEPVEFSRSGMFLTAATHMFSGDFRQLVYAMRQELTYKVLDQAVIQDAAGNIIFNLAQQDMVALRATMRLAWQVPNPINRLQPVEASRYPFAILTT